MDLGKLKVVEFEDLHIAVTIEAQIGDEHEVYYPANFLVYIEKGELTIYNNNENHVVKQGEFCLVKKYTHGKYLKRKEGNLDGFKEVIFLLHDTFIQEIVNDFKISGSIPPITKNVISLKSTPILMGLISSIKHYFQQDEAFDHQLIRLKTKEAILAITQNNPDLLYVFHDFSQPARANLKSFMENNFNRGFSIEQLAKMSGRSISTFNRDFKEMFNTTPHKWIKNKRLELALYILSNTNRKSSDIYLEVGFEDLAHFSRSFKNYFGYNPTSVKAPC